MWCICCPSENIFTEEWENDIEDIIVNIKKARKLGKIRIEQKRYGRQEPQLENEILELIKKVDADVLSMKRKAVYFLTTNTTLYSERYEQIEFYKQQAQQQMHMRQLQQELMRLTHEHKRATEENLMLKEECRILREQNLQHHSDAGTSHNLLKINHEHLLKIDGKNQELNRLQLEESLLKLNKLIDNLKHLLSGYDHEQNKLKSELQGQTMFPRYGGIPDLHIASFWLDQKLENQRMLLKQDNIGYPWNKENNSLNRSDSAKDKFRLFFRTGWKFRQNTTQYPVESARLHGAKEAQQQEEEEKLLVASEKNEDIELVTFNC